MSRPENEDKEAWCRLGEKAEDRFLGPAFRGGVSLFKNPAKEENPYLNDCFIVLPSDLKTIRTRFETADRYGIPSRTAITINKKDVDRYLSKWPLCNLVLDIDFGDWRSLRVAPIREINRAIKSGAAKLHTYRNRVDDRDGNAKESYVLNALWFQELVQ